VIKAIVVDDEAPARREMRRLLAEHERVSVTGEARDLATSRGLLLRTRPDVVFLDIRLGRESGFDLLPDVDEETAVVFVTAYDDHAVRAFEASALDYLMKPVESTRLKATLKRVERFVAAREQGGAATRVGSPAPFTPSRWVFLEAGDRPAFVPVEAITHVSAEKGRSRVHVTGGHSLPSERSLEEWMRRLPIEDFRRVHRSTIVNLRQVERLEPWSHYTYRIHLRGTPEPVVMSRRHALRLREALG
jgi:two-component system LytT family response regulator